MSHLDICSTSYDEKKGQESNWQFDPDHQKSGIDPTPVCAGEVRHIVGKLSMRAITLL
jgi:hypothetical protein